MPNLSWNEVQDRAIAFSRRWAGEASEAGGKQTFWNEFFAVFGRDRRTVASFEVAVKNLHGKFNYIDLLWRGMLLVEHKSAGKSLDVAESQAFAYIEDLAREQRFDEIPRFVIVSDFSRIALYDLEPEEQATLPLFAGIHYTRTEFPLVELHKYKRHFAFLKGERAVRLDPEDPANDEAYSRMCQVHDALKAGGFTGTDLEKLLVRLLFCLFAEDTEVFEPNTFTSFLRDHTREDGSDLGARLNELFHFLNTPRDKWPATSEEIYGNFKYVNGQLFADHLAFAPFTRAIRNALLAAADFSWTRVSPAVFGSLFQGIMDDRERRQQGAHYTSERDIMKVIRSLFLDELRAEFDTIRADKSTRRVARLESFHDKLRSLRFLDPACGCGNFLVLAYRELRLLELDVLLQLNGHGQTFFNVPQLIQVDVDQFYGIEFAEWPCRIAEVALWLMDHQMNLRVSEAFGQSFQRLPLNSTPHIVQGNALRIAWNEVLTPNDCVYVLGNPPFVGKQFRSPTQQADMDDIWRGVKGAGVLDYVTCWYKRATEYIVGTKARTGFVSTNSISQGEQVGILWDELFKRWNVKIHFGHRTFPWMSEARGKAHVHVVIVGFGVYDSAVKRLYDYDPNGQVTATEPVNISPYLVAGSDLVIRKRTKSLCGKADIVFGSMPNDGGHRLLSAPQRAELIANEPRAAKYLRRILGAEEFLNGIERWCLWLLEASPKELRALPHVMARIEAVRKHREGSSRETTRELASRPAVFGEIRQPSMRYLLIPGVSSIHRQYIPMGFQPAKVIGSNLVYCFPGATTWDFGILSSAMHTGWVRTVCGRLKSDFRYSNQLVYNNFPWPDNVSASHRAAVVKAAKAVLESRKPFLSTKDKGTLADLYDPLTMPAPLSRAHAALDRAVDRCYRRELFRSERERVEHLFSLYEKLTAPLLPEDGKKRRRPKGTK